MIELYRISEFNLHMDRELSSSDKQKVLQIPHGGIFNEPFCDMFLGHKKEI